MGLFLGLGLFAEWHWTFDLLTHFRWQYAALLVGCGGMLILLRRPIKGAASLALGGLVLATLLPSAPALAPASAATLKVVCFNVLQTNERRDKICDFLEKENADVVALTEVTEEWSTEIDRLQRTYPFILTSTPKQQFDIVILSRHPFLATDIERYRTHRWAEVTVDVNGTPYHFAAAHTAPPISGIYSRARNDQLMALADTLAGRPNTILCGDLNVTPFFPWFANLVKRSRMTDTSQGAGYSPTWMRALPPLAVPIDHVLLSPDLTLVKRTIGPSLGSDHNPVIVELARSSTNQAVADR